MASLMQKCRPRHQALVLKCYPKTQKTAVDVKPNSSELNYLSFYISTRRSKIEKVGEFLVKKTTSDVNKRSLGDVQVTLQILTALVEKSPKDHNLYAQIIISILKIVLSSHDLTLVETSLPLFDAFCVHHDGSILMAIQQYLDRFVEVLEYYAVFASGEPAGVKPSLLTPPVVLRWRKAGLQALKILAAAEPFNNEVGRQYPLIMPVIMQNIYLDNYELFLTLQHRAQSKENKAGPQTSRRKMSIAIARTNEPSDTSSAPLSKTTADADKLAEEDIGLVAFDTLKKLFALDDPRQIRLATVCVIDYILCKTQRTDDESENQNADYTEKWAASILETIAGWVPVQSRYIIAITIMELATLEHSNSIDEMSTLITLLSWLLSSDVNLIGLNVMDVLFGLLDISLDVLKFGGHKSSEGMEVTPQSIKSAKASSTGSEKSTNLLIRLHKCIANLATHIYYSDQVSDIISAILMRLKPSPVSTVRITTPDVEDLEEAVNATTETAVIDENANADDIFNFATARVMALKTIRELLRIANLKNGRTGADVIGRNKVSVEVWNGTQWLLRDPDPTVRKVYVDTLMTWLHDEVPRSALKAVDEPVEYFPPHLHGKAKSAASRDRSPRPQKSYFYHLLNLAMYENAIFFSESEEDMALLFILLVTLTDNLGVNAIKHNLPMIMRLQEDIQELETPTAKINVGSLVHSYLWYLCERFGLESSKCGEDILKEIRRRRKRGLWIRGVCLSTDPDALPELTHANAASLNWKELEHGALRPFDRGPFLVILISRTYDSSPYSSPPGSPTKGFTKPLFGRKKSGGDTLMDVLPELVQSQMSGPWSKDRLLNSIERDMARTASINGSRNDVNPSRNRSQKSLAHPDISAALADMNCPPIRNILEYVRPTLVNPGLASVTGSGPKSSALHRKDGSIPDSPTAKSSSSRRSMLRFAELKRKFTKKNKSASLTTDATRKKSHQIVPKSPSNRSDLANQDTSSASMVSAAGFSGSDASFHDAQVDTHDFGAQQSPGSSTHRDRPNSSGTKVSFVPPVPAVPSKAQLPGGFPSETAMGDSPRSSTSSGSRKGLDRKSRKFWSGSLWRSGGKKDNVTALLGDIEPRRMSNDNVGKERKDAGANDGWIAARPPY